MTGGGIKSIDRKAAFAAATAVLYAMATAGPAWSAKLGPLSVASDFGEPLKANVEIIEIEPGERPLDASLASPEGYAELGLVRPASLAGAGVELKRLPGDRWAIRVTTLRAVDEPEFNLVLVLTTSTGRLLRHYRIAADPVPRVPPAAAKPVAPVSPPAPIVADSVPAVSPVSPLAPIVADPLPPVSPHAAIVADPVSPVSPPAAIAADPLPPASPRVASPAARLPAGASTPRAPTQASASQSPNPERVSRNTGPNADTLAADAAMRQARLRLDELESSVVRLTKRLDALVAQVASNQSGTSSTSLSPRDGSSFDGGGPGRASAKQGGADFDPGAFEASLAKTQARVKELEATVARLTKLIEARNVEIASTMSQPRTARSPGAPVTPPKSSEPSSEPSQSELRRAQLRVSDLESNAARLTRLIEARDAQIAFVKAELSALGVTDGTVSSPPANAPVIAASAEPARPDERQEPSLPLAADEAFNPMTVGAGIAALLLGGLLWARRARTSRGQASSQVAAEEPDSASTRNDEEAESDRRPAG